MRHLGPHHVETVQSKGWSGIKNGRLLTLAQQDFEILITIDSNMIYQQHVPSFAIGLLVLHALSNRLEDLLPLVPEVLTKIGEVKPGEIAHVGN